MAQTSPKMLLRLWDQLSDLFAHDQLMDNFSKIDFHDHTPGRGVQVPTEGIADGAITSAKLISTLDPGPLYTTYKTINVGRNDFGASNAAGTYLTAEQRPTSLSIGTPTSFQAIWYFDPADYSAGTRSTVMRLRMSTFTNGTAPAITFTGGIYPVSSIVTGQVTVGSVLVGSTIAIASPAINTMTTGVTADFAVPLAGYYVAGFATSGTSAVSSSTQVRTELQIRQI